MTSTCKTIQIDHGAVFDITLLYLLEMISIAPRVQTLRTIWRFRPRCNVDMGYIHKRVPNVPTSAN